MEDLQRKLEHLKKNFHFTEAELKDISLLYRGLPYPEQSEGIAKLRAVSQKACDEFNALFTVPENKSADKRKKKKLLRLLFPLLPNTPGEIRRGLHLVIGLVDISNFTFINVGANFGENTLVKLGHWTQIGPNFSVSESSGPASRILIDDEAWLGGKVNVASGVTIGKQTVVGSGARVEENIAEKVLAIGRPAHAIKEIPVVEEFKSAQFEVYTKEEQELIRAHYKKIRHQISKKAFGRIYSGATFSTLSIRLGLLYLFTHGLCKKLDDPTLTDSEREDIYDVLFPIRGKNLKIGKNFFLDLAGTVSLGDNVTIGDNVAIGGLVRIASGATIGDGCLLFGSNHPLSAKKRKIGFNKGLGLSIPIAYVPIHIGENVTLGRDAVIAPKADIKTSVPDGALVDPKGKIIL